ncbi:Pentatricopeptide repeat-containing protein [Hibiscus syriacus]|uniref:Pentatricopeptide repeat-containing protein n=1 Tax=Hibiscus syriacus TaxID=106335 RepID=A0A6A2ZHI2_HIBSY|nr:pentatricopeptide repeat-containing protein At3g21470-like [Hibiscus syriacus]KAE8690809.1 Pentatricopeptide repeat-containing protein [Hibiscus syriacus]
MRRTKLPQNPQQAIRIVENIAKTSSNQNQPSWSFIIRNHLSEGNPDQVLSLHTQIRQQGLYILGLVPLIFKACASASASASAQTYGKSLHAESIKFGVSADLHISSSLISMYSRCSNLIDSRKVFDEMPERNVVAWNAMIGGYLKNGDRESALNLFEKMPMGRNSVTWIEMIDGFAKSGDTLRARQLFDRVPLELSNVVTWTVMVDGYNANGELEAAREIFEMMPERNYFVWSSMISGFCKRGDVKEAREFFDRIPVRNSVNWNSMISGYAQNGFCEEALAMFRKMQNEGFEPDEVTITSVLSACAQLGELDVGKEIHYRIKTKGMKANQFVSNALLDMYAKCGDLGQARLIFERISHRKTACWNSMLSGFAIHGKCREALEFFKRMEELNEMPDAITFLSVLSACSHGGCVDEGLEIFSKMETYGILASIKHYGCLVDLLGRAGRLKEAFGLVKRMPMKPNDVVWGALLGACKIHVDNNVLEQVMQEVVGTDNDLDSGDNSHHVLLSNIYAASDRWEKAEKMRMAMVNKGFQKIPGLSSIIPNHTERQVLPV